jgi:hypothetical protein
VLVRLALLVDRDQQDVRFLAASTTWLTENIVLLNQVAEHQAGIPKSSSVRFL